MLVIFGPLVRVIISLGARAAGRGKNTDPSAYGEHPSEGPAGGGVASLSRRGYRWELLVGLIGGGRAPAGGRPATRQACRQRANGRPPLALSPGAWPACSLFSYLC